MHRFRNLEVWSVALDLVEETYRTTATLPRSEQFGLIPQMRRAAVSIPSNIAEATGAASPKAFARYLRIAYGSSAELETQTMIARRLEMIDEATTIRITSEAERVRRMLTGLINQA